MIFPGFYIASILVILGCKAVFGGFVPWIFLRVCLFFGRVLHGFVGWFGFIGLFDKVLLDKGFI